MELARRRATRMRGMKASLLAKLASLDRGLAASVSSEPALRPHAALLNHYFV